MGTNEENRHAYISYGRIIFLYGIDNKGILPQLCGTPLQLGEACFCRFQLFLPPDQLGICRLSRKKIQCTVWLDSPLNTQNKRISFPLYNIYFSVSVVFKESTQAERLPYWCMFNVLGF